MLDLRVRPWWERYPEWWASQLTQLRVSSLRGQLVTDGLLVGLHTQRWVGQMPTTRGEVALTIDWGPGTPFSPPLLKSPGLCSQLHQLSDGTLCLLPPESTHAGYSGVKDIRFWLKQAGQWISQFFIEGWAQDPLHWLLLTPNRPGPGYRTAHAPARVLALPPCWKDGPPGPHGLLEVVVPRAGVGMAAVVAWETRGREGRWETGSGLVEDPVTVGGMWMEEARVLESDLSGPRMNGFRSAIAEIAHASQQRRRAVVGMSWGPSGWRAHQLEVSTVLALPDQLTLADLVHLQRFKLHPMVIDPTELDARRLAGREADMHERIANARVLLVGLGALGSEVAHLLAQEGVRHFELVDGDLLLPGNVTRHRADLSMVGQPKVEAVKRLIERVNPEAEVKAHQGWFDERIPKLGALEAGTLIIGATGSEEQELILGEAALEMRLPCLHAWLEVQGRVLRVVRAAPNHDPALLDVATRSPSPIMRLTDAAEAPGTCAELVLPGAPMDLHCAANFVARRALDLIGGGLSPENHWLFTPSGAPERVDLPTALRGPFGLVAEAVPR